MDEAARQAPGQGDRLTEVVVRMYRTLGLGDCFLLRFHTSGGRDRFMLIDCGVFMGTDGGSQRMRDIAANVMQETGGALDVLAVTHEHWDHLSGFYYARDIFLPLAVGRVWMGWTEKPGDKDAEALQQVRRRVRRVARRTTHRLALGQDPRGESLENLLAFNGPLDADDEDDVPAGAHAFTAARSPAERPLPTGSTSSILNFLRSMVGEVDYLCPGEAPLQLDGVDGLRIYVLGPPTDPDFLHRSTPLAGQVYGFAPDTYVDGTQAGRQLGLDADDLARVVSGSGAARPGGQGAAAVAPFDLADAVPVDAAPLNAAGEEVLYKRYLETDAWRRVDDAETDSTELLALRLDEDTNNTSLVLAFELIESGKVLLFPGDAQVGNWLSWEGLEWVDPTLENRQVKLRELLERTVLYKVGHHGSHNATARKPGLEAMGSEELSALLPVYEQQASDMGWQMPAPALYEELVKKTAGRILRMDQAGGEALWLEVVIR